MGEIFGMIGNAAKKYGLFPAVALVALLLGGYGCYMASMNAHTIQAQEVAVARLDARLDANTKELSANIQRMDNTLIELTTQIKLLVEGRLVVGSHD